MVHSVTIEALQAHLLSTLSLVALRVKHTIHLGSKTDVRARRDNVIMTHEHMWLIKAILRVRFYMEGLSVCGIVKNV